MSGRAAVSGRWTARRRWAAAIAIGGAVIAGIAYRGWLPGAWRIKGWISDARHERKIARFAAEAGSVPAGRVVFLGSSTVDRFPFDAVFPGAPCLDRGVGGDTTKGLLARIDRSLPVQRPAGFVVYSGANDLRGHGEDPAAIVVAMGSLLDALSARFPGVPAAIVEVMPVCDPPAGEPERRTSLNAGIADLARARGASFVRTNRPPLVDDGGRLARAMSEDGEHLNGAGYRVLGRWIAEDGGAATAALR